MSYEIGSSFINKQNLKYVIIEKIDYYRSKIRFDKSGYEKVVYNTAIKGNTLSDDTYSIICGIAVKDIKVPYNDMLYNRWKNIINRCYNPKHISYKDYGAKGCYVHEKWLLYSNFLRDISEKENYESLISNPTKWHLDKDILHKGNKCYCNEYVIIVSKTTNISESNSRTRSVEIYQYDLDMNFIQSFKSIKEAERITGILGVAKSSLKEKENEGYIFLRRKI